VKAVRHTGQAQQSGYLCPMADFMQQYVHHDLSGCCF
jgi:hypothetical protein